jgi:hypothetical protein
LAPKSIPNGYLNELSLLYNNNNSSNTEHQTTISFEKYCFFKTTLMTTPAKLDQMTTIPTDAIHSCSDSQSFTNQNTNYFCYLHSTVRKFSTRKSFLSHQRRYHSELADPERRKCLTCGKMFSTVDAMQRHQKKTCKEMGKLGKCLSYLYYVVSYLTFFVSISLHHSIDIQKYKHIVLHCFYLF